MPKSRRLNLRLGLIDTPAFKTWFAGSVAVDANGAPLVLFHGSNSRFDIFSWEKTRAGFCLTTTWEYAHEWALDSACEDGERPYVYPLFASISDPIEVDAGGAHWSEIPDPFDSDDEREIDDVARDVYHRGFDSLIVRNVMDLPDTMAGTLIDTYFVFDPTKLKSATRNRGTFDPKNPDIRF